MSRTLFWYIFKDLVRIFGAASGAIAGIMSFGALMRPLTQFGLDGSQVMKMLMYFNPAMMTYSLPIAALFATTVVYGRLAADNEVVACRASGISHFALAAPAVVLGALVMVISAVMLYFVVPVASLQVEKVIYSNIAKLVAHQIEQTHSIKIGNFTVFAQDAILPAGQSDSTNQVVELIGPMFVRYEPRDPKNWSVLVPREFWTARQATAYIREDSSKQRVTFQVALSGGSKFPRSFSGGVQAGVETTQFGPIEIPSPVREHPKFMNVWQLTTLSQDLSKSRKIKAVLADFVRDEQERLYRQQLLGELNGPAGEIKFESGEGTYLVTRSDAPARLERDEIVISRLAASASPRFSQDENLRREAAAAKRVKLTEQRGGHTLLSAEANEIRLRVHADTTARRVNVTAECYDAQLYTGDAPVPRRSFMRGFNVAMPDKIALVEQRTPQEFLMGKAGSKSAQDHLNHELVVLSNYIQSEYWSRFSFSVSCCILVVVGCALGLMFRSGNFLSAFAVSVIPALLCIVLIVSGQHTIERVPDIVSAANNPLLMGMILVWSGNAIVLLIAIVLWTRLQSQ